MLKQNSTLIDDKDDFYGYFTPQNLDLPEIHGGFAHSHWCGDARCETQVKEDLGVTIRCIPFDPQPEAGACISCGKPGAQRVVYAKAY